MEGCRVNAGGRNGSGWPRAALFDLDGTLIDSAPDIAAATNELLARRGLGPLTLAQVISMIGNGTKKLTERAFAATSGPLSRAAGVTSVLLRGGYINVPAEKLGADLVIDGLGELVGALPALKPRA